MAAALMVERVAASDDADAPTSCVRPREGERLNVSEAGARRRLGAHKGDGADLVAKVERSMVAQGGVGREARKERAEVVPGGWFQGKQRVMQKFRGSTRVAFSLLQLCSLGERGPPGQLLSTPLTIMA